MKHPLEIIGKANNKNILKYAAAAELNSRLTKEQIKIIFKNNWFGLFVPKKYGGLELSFVEALETEESLAYTDGSAGWTVTLCSGACWFIGFMDIEIGKKVFAMKNVCLAGSGKITGVAKQTKTGYEITGHWQYATGSNIATVFTANCEIIPLKSNKNAVPEIASFWFYKNEVSVEDSWKGNGMIATASNNYFVKKLKVPANRKFIINPSCRTLNYPIFQYPFLQFAEATLAVNYSGMACRFLELSKLIFEDNKAKYLANNRYNVAIAIWQTCQNDLETAREEFYQTIKTSWEMLLQKKPLTAQVLGQISSQARNIYKTSYAVFTSLYPLSGLQAANTHTEINRLWRNFFTATQHPLLNFPK